MVKAVAMLSVFGLGMCFALLGSLSVKLMPRLKMDQGKFGSLISGFMFSCLVASLILGVAIDKIGYQPIAIIGFILVAICIFILARGQTYTTVLLPCVLLGFGAMALNTAGNVLGPQVLYGGENPAAASNLLNVFFGLGLFLTPMIVSFLFRKTSYENSVSVLAIIALVPAFFALLAKFPETPPGFEIGDAFGLLAEPAVLVAGLVLFCYIALEASFCNWLPSFGKEVIKTETPGVEDGAADASAQRLLSLFAIAMMAGRFGASQIDAITKYGSYVIAGAAAVSAVIIVIMMQTKNRSLAQILAVLSGLAFAPCFPTTVGVTFSKFDASIYGSIFGIIFAVGLSGAVIIPKAMGNLAKGSSIQKSLKLLLPACVLLLVLALILGPLEARNEDIKAKPDVKAAAEPQAPAESTEEMLPLPIELPEKMFVGTPTNMRGVKNLQTSTDSRPPFLAPAGCTNVALHKKVTSSDMAPIVGKLDLITDGDKEAIEGCWVELAPMVQWVQIDLGSQYDIYAVLFWHYHRQARVYFDVVVQLADDPDFTTNVRTIFNNDLDNSIGQGAGTDKNYVETAEGKLVDAEGLRARYVRLYSNGCNADDQNFYTEIEVYGKPAQ